MRAKEGSKQGQSLEKGGWEGEQTHLPEKSGYEARGENPPTEKLTNAETERKVRERFFN